jgi:hypothetical protein
MESGVSRFLPRNHDVTHDEKVDLGAQEAIERLLWRANHRFVLVERRIEHHGNPRDREQFTVA